MSVFGLGRRRLLGLVGLRTLRLVFRRILGVGDFLETLGCILFVCFLGLLLLRGFLLVYLGCSIGFLVLS